MRLLKHLQHSGLDKNTNKFRSLDIKLSDKKTNYEKIVKDVEEKYAVDCNIQEDINRLNKELKKVYNGGKWWFDLCLVEGKKPSDMNIDKKIKKRMQKLFLEINEKFSNIKFDIERKIANK